MADSVEVSEIVWPYRPDILIRLDFLKWFEQSGRELLGPCPRPLTACVVRESGPFFAEAMAHPFFVQYTRKQKFRVLNLSRSDSERVFAQGVADFLNLLADIEAHGFDPRHRIEIQRSLLFRPPESRSGPPRRYYIGDGCHRFTCLLWLTRPDAVPRSHFTVRYKLAHRPLDWVSLLRRMRVLDDEAAADFDRLFSEGVEEGAQRWERVFEWTRGVRERFRSLDVDDILAIRFNE